MEGGGTTEQDYKEIEMLLGEIPNATRENPRPGQPTPQNHPPDFELISLEERNRSLSPHNKFTNLYSSPQSAKNGANMAMCGINLAFSTSPIDQKLKNNGKMGNPNGGYGMPALDVEQESNLPDDKSLTLAFEELGLGDGPVSKSTAPVNYNEAAFNRSFLNNSSTLFRIDALEMATPQKPEMLLGNCNLAEKQQSFPIYSRAMALNSGMHAYNLRNPGPIPGMELTASPYQRQSYLDAQSPAFMPSRHLGSPNLTWQNLEEERYYRLNQQYLCQQQLLNHRPDVHQIQNSVNSYFGISNDQNAYYKDNAVLRGYTCQNMMMANDVYQYLPQSSCGNGESYDLYQVLDKVGKEYYPEKILTRSHGVNSLRSLRPGSVTTNPSTFFSDNNGNVVPNGHGRRSYLMGNGSFELQRQNSRSSSADSSDSTHASKSLQARYNSVDEVVGRIYSLAKDQHGCRFLQRKFTEGSREDVDKIFVEIIGHILELMTDPFGNYLVQKLLDVCNVEQRILIIHAITRESGELIKISCNMHGTRAVQKVVEMVRTPDQISKVVSSLKPGIISLIKDVNGNHVAQRCLQYFPPEYSEFLFEAAISHCVELATDRHGCCVLQKLILHSIGEWKDRMICEICSYSLVLSQDPFGNYVVQYVLEQNASWATVAILDQLEGNYEYLSIQKHSSNVVEKCLRLASEEDRAKIIHELMSTPRILQILHDPYGNYVIQSALNESKGVLNAALVEVIRPHMPALRSSPYGKKVLSNSSLKK